MRVKVLTYVLIMLSIAVAGYGQGRHVVSGRVSDPEDRPIVGATVVIESSGVGTAADGEGRWTLHVPAGEHTFVCSSLGYAAGVQRVRVDGSRTLDFTLAEELREIDEITVSTTSPFDRVRGVQIGQEKIEMDEMALMPAMFGERDIMKSIQLLPGVKAESDGSSGFQVRGGTTSQNMVLLDEAPVYNSGHLMGFFSAFNDKVLSDATLYKGLIPAQYGGGTSSVFAVNTRGGSYKNFRFGGSVGLLSAKLHAEGPIVRNKASFFVTARRTYMDAFLNLTEKYKGNTLNFYDLNARINWDIGDRDKLFVSFFTGRDKLALQDDRLAMKWGNMTGTVRWYHVFSDKVYSNTSFIYSDYATTNGASLYNMFYSFDGSIRQAGLKENVGWSPSERHNVDIGFQTMYLDVMSGDWDFTSYRQRERRSAWENIAWINDEWEVSDRFGLSAGIRFNLFTALGGSPYYRLNAMGDIVQTIDPGKWKAVKTRFGVEPRLSMNFRVDDRRSIKAGYSRTSQNIHAVRNTSISLPFDRYTMSSNIVEPQVADQISVGYAALTRNGMFEFSLEGYYKSVRNVLDYRDGKSFQSEIEIERIVAAGKGRAYGMELLVRKNTGDFTGWISYTLSWSQNRIPGINGGRWYTASNDRRHDLSVVGMYRFDEHWHAAVTWVYNTGQAMTAPNAKYKLDGETTFYYAERNGYRAPDYHRLDASVTWTKKGRRWTHEVSFGAFNVYNRYNAFIIIFEGDHDKPTGTKATKISLFGIVPSVSYAFEF